MAAPETVRITADSTRAELETAIAALRVKQRRLPAHWVDSREEVAVAIEALVGQWLAS